MIIYILCGGLFGVIISAIIAFLICRKKIKITSEINKEIDDKNKEAEEKLISLNETIQKENDNIKNIINEKIKLNEELQIQNEHSKEQAEAFYNNLMEIHTNRLNSDLETIEAKYQEAENDYKNSFLLMMNDAANEYKEKIGLLNEEFFSLNNRLEDTRKMVEVALNERKRAMEMEEKESFYKIIISDEDKRDVKKLREVIPFLKDAEPINKVIWSVYYKNPSTDMIGRVVGEKNICGIYKITNINNGMSYIGQSVNIKSRFLQHIKRGLGAETATRNKLYPAMYSIGPEHFTFEVLEECDKDKLDSREDYWQEYYHSIDYGYSIK